MGESEWRMPLECFGMPSGRVRDVVSVAQFLEVLQGLVCRDKRRGDAHAHLLAPLCGETDGCHGMVGGGTVIVRGYEMVVGINASYVGDEK